MVIPPATHIAIRIMTPAAMPMMRPLCDEDALWLWDNVPSVPVAAGPLVPVPLVAAAPPVAAAVISVWPVVGMLDSILYDLVSV